MKAKTDSNRGWRRYYALSKPGIIYANVMTAAAGYFFASEFKIDVATMLGLLVGMALIIASACAANNYLDQGVDARMQRTNRRALVTGTLSGHAVIAYAVVTVCAGAVLLALTQNRLTLLLVAIAYVDYVVLYGIGKRKSVHGTLVGAVSGSLPLVAGYTAVHGQLNTTAWLLFALMTAWQMAHFYGIALYRRKDYAAASIPVMPVVYGTRATKLQIVGYMAAYILVGGWLTLGAYIGVIGGIVLVASGAWWLVRNVRRFAEEPAVWGRQVFISSLSVVLAMSLALALGPVLP